MDDITILHYELRELYYNFPHLKRSYFFLPRSDETVLDWALCGVTQPYIWLGAEHPSLIQHVEDTTFEIFDRWEQYNYVEELSVKVLDGANYSSFYSYTEEMLKYLCVNIASLLGLSENGQRVVKLDHTLKKYGVLALHIQQLTSTATS